MITKKIKKSFSKTIFYLLKNFRAIILLSFFTSFISININNYISSKEEFFFHKVSNFNNYKSNIINLKSTLRKLNFEQKKIFLRNYFFKSIINILINTYFISNLIIIIRLTPYYLSVSMFRSFAISIPFFPRLFLLNFLLIILIQIGFIFIIPGIFLFIIFNIAPILLINKNLSVLTSLNESIILIYKNFNTLVPIILLWLMIKIFLFLLLLNLKYFLFFLHPIVLGGFINIISAIFLIYLYHLIIILRITEKN